MDGDEYALQLGNFQDSGGIGTEFQGEAVGCSAVGKDLRERFSIWYYAQR